MLNFVFELKICESKNLRKEMGGKSTLPQNLLSLRFGKS